MSTVAKAIITAEIETVEAVIGCARRYRVDEEFIAKLIEYRTILEKDLVEESGE